MSDIAFETRSLASKLTFFQSSSSKENLQLFTLASHGIAFQVDAGLLEDRLVVGAIEGLLPTEKQVPQKVAGLWKD